MFGQQDIREIKRPDILEIMDGAVDRGAHYQANRTLKRSLVNGAQRLELAGWSAARLDWYKAQGCFTEIIRYRTRLFAPTEGAPSVLMQLSE